MTERVIARSLGWLLDGISRSAAWRRPALTRGIVTATATAVYESVTDSFGVRSLVPALEIDDTTTPALNVNSRIDGGEPALRVARSTASRTVGHLAPSDIAAKSGALEASVFFEMITSPALSPPVLAPAFPPAPTALKE